MPDSQRRHVVEVAMEVLRFVLGGVGFLVLFPVLMRVGDTVFGAFGALVGLFVGLFVCVGVVMVGERVRELGGVVGLLDEGRFYVRDLFMPAVESWKEQTAGDSIMRCAARLLPSATRGEYVEEWRAWLSDLREDGEPWYRRLAELLVIVLVAAPQLAIICRLGHRQAKDRAAKR
ncbi:MAG: hypothetical protein ACRDTT_10820 [Pseudonocardiaceae bacterium]